MREKMSVAVDSFKIVANLVCGREQESLDAAHSLLVKSESDIQFFHGFFITELMTALAVAVKRQWIPVVDRLIGVFDKLGPIFPTAAVLKRAAELLRPRYSPHPNGAHGQGDEGGSPEQLQPPALAHPDELLDGMGEVSDLWQLPESVGEPSHPLGAHEGEFLLDDEVGGGQACLLLGGLPLGGFGGDGDDDGCSWAPEGQPQHDCSL